MVCILKRSEDWSWWWYVWESSTGSTWMCRELWTPAMMFRPFLTNIPSRLSAPRGCHQSASPGCTSPQTSTETILFSRKGKIYRKICQKWSMKTWSPNWITKCQIKENSALFKKLSFSKQNGRICYCENSSDQELDLSMIYLSTSCQPHSSVKTVVSY